MNALQTAFQHSQTTRPDHFSDAELFSLLLKSGFSVIRHSSARYCTVTNARLPQDDHSILAAFRCRNEAISYWQQHLDRFGHPHSDEDYQLLHPYQPEDRLSAPIIGTLCDEQGVPIPATHWEISSAPQAITQIESDEVPF